MTSITLVSVSAPAVKNTVLYARSLREQGIDDVDFGIFYFNGDRDNRRLDFDDMRARVLSSDLCIVDLMAVEEDTASKVYDIMTGYKGQRIIVGKPGPLTQKLGKYDEKRFRANPDDVAAVAAFQDYYMSCEGRDLKSAYDMVLKKYYGYAQLPDPEPLNKNEGVYIKDPTNGRVYYSRRDFFADFPRQHENIVTLFYNALNYPYDSSAIIRYMVERFREFADVVPIGLNGYDEMDMDRLRELVGDETSIAISMAPFRFISGPFGGSSTEAMKLLRHMDAPFLRPFFMSRNTRQEWEESTAGLKVPEFMIFVFFPELDGGTVTIPIGTFEEVETIEEYNLVLSEVRPIPDRMDRLCGKMKGLLRLRNLANSDKKVAIVGYNYPPGEGNMFGGSFIDTFGSLDNILRALEKNGYDIGDLPTDRLKDEFLDEGIINDGDWLTPSEAGTIRFRGREKHPQAVTDEWGPAPGDVLADRRGYRIPGVVHGNVFIGLQPPLTTESLDKLTEMYHDPYIPPHHQYFAFYEWIRDEFKADAVVHIGTHGTLEFLPGKEVAMSGECYPDMILGDTPHFYLYYVGNPSEAVLAKRRSHGALISYMSPPYEHSDLYGDLSELEDLIAEYRESCIVDTGRSINVLEEIYRRAEEMRLPEDIDELEHELDDIRTSLIPKGLHRIGEPYTVEEAEQFAIGSMMFTHEGCRPLAEIFEERDTFDDPAAMAPRLYWMYNRGKVPWGYEEDQEVLDSLRYEKKIWLDARECHEIDGLLKSLDCRFVDVKVAGDFMRNPEVIPTGYNMVQFNPKNVPTETAFERGRETAENTLRLYYQDHGEYPKSVALVMWGLEISRTQGATIGQILTYLGLRMVNTAGTWHERFEVIPLEELGRPRIDVSVTICGFFRDMFSNLVDGLNRIFALVDGLDESDEDNRFKADSRLNYEKLIAEGYSEEDARDLSVCRLFGPGEGLYGTTLSDAINTSSWETEDELADIFDHDMKYAYSFRHRGFDAKGLMRRNHEHVDMVSQIRANVEYELVDLDHYYEFFGGLSKTVEKARGSKAAMYITDNTGAKIKTQDVKTSIEHGIRTRLLNPKWIDGLLESDYHGAQKINDRFENVLGLAATTGAVESSVFSDMEKTYITDEEMRERIRKNNNWALLSMIKRLYEANERGYWSATEEELNVLREAYLQSEETAEEETDRD